jgi:hypothetical protein
MKHIEALESKYWKQLLETDERETTASEIAMLQQCCENK